MTQNNGGEVKWFEHGGHKNVCETKFQGKSKQGNPWRT